MMWKAIKGFNSYEVSFCGKVRNSAKGKILKPEVNTSGYERVTLCSEGQKHRKFVHQIVAENWIGKESGKVVNHLNGDRRDNRACNLEYTTPSENRKHGIRAGSVSFKYGEENPASKLTYLDVDFIRYWGSKGYSQKEISEVFPVVRQTISKIINNRTWNEEKGELYERGE